MSLAWQMENAAKSLGQAAVLADAKRIQAQNTLRTVRGELLDMADSVSGWQHNSGCEGEPDCFACIEETLRRIADMAVTPDE